jgi:Tol biopolymer transport system component
LQDLTPWVARGVQAPAFLYAFVQAREARELRRGTWALALACALMTMTAGRARADRFAVTTNPYTFGQAPDWMPDGRVVFHDDFGDGQQVYVAGLDGSGRRCLTCDMPAPNMVAAVQPGGRHILFHSSDGHQLNVGAPGFGGIGSDIWVMDADGSHKTRLTTSSEGHDNFHAYWSPDGTRIVWTALNWNFVTEKGNGKSDIRVADFVDDAKGMRLANERVIRPGNGHWYESQRWAPDGSGFLYTESTDTSVDNELFYADLRGATPKFTRLTDNPAWDEQAVFTPDAKRVIFMSTRDHPGAFQDWTTLASTAGIPADEDYITLLPVFEATFLQPVFAQANDLYELDLATKKVRRLTHDGDEGWITPELVWDRAGRRLLWTEVKWRDELRVDQSGDPVTEARQAAGLASSPPTVSPDDTHHGGQNSNLRRRTRIGRYVR